MRCNWPEWAKFPVRNIAYRDFVVKNSHAIFRGQLWCDANGREFVTDFCNNCYNREAFE